MKLYIVVLEDGSIEKRSEILENDIKDFEDGYIFDITDPEHPTIYENGQWNIIP